MADLCAFMPFVPFRQSLQLLSLTTMTDVSRPLPPPSNQLAGVSPQPTPLSQHMAILSWDRASSSLASILHAHPRLNRFISNHLHHPSHAPWACPFGNHSIKQNILCCWQRTMLISCIRMSNSQQRYPYQHLATLPVSLSSTFSMDVTQRRLCMPAQQYYLPMVFACLLTRA
jgi:hypothetical protein